MVFGKYEENWKPQSYAKIGFLSSYIPKLNFVWFDNQILNSIGYQISSWLKLETLDTLMWMLLCVDCGKVWLENIVTNSIFWNCSTFNLHQANIKRDFHKLYSN
jgi:hypothetical protein